MENYREILIDMCDNEFQLYSGDGKCRRNEMPYILLAKIKKINRDNLTPIYFCFRAFREAAKDLFSQCSHDFRSLTIQTAEELDRFYWWEENSIKICGDYGFSIDLPRFLYETLFVYLPVAGDVHDDEENRNELLTHSLYEVTGTAQPTTEASSPEAETQSAYKLILDKKQETKVLENYAFWDNNENSAQGYINIFKNITQQTFLQMVIDADFSQIHTRPIRQRVRYNVFVLSRLLGCDWGEVAAQKLGQKNLRECGKTTIFDEFLDIKTMYLP